MIRASNIRLPGVYFLPSSPARGLGLPPLDVAAFVGFAERGPLDWPVAIEDLDAYRAIFGGDVALAREQGGRTVYANLPLAVASFFAQGGRRCHVVRVAGSDATRTLFRLRGLVSLSGSHEAGSTETPKLASAWASSEGRWSADLRLGARLRSTPLPPEAFKALPPQAVTTPDGPGVAQRLSWETGSAPEAIQRGDLLRLAYDDERQYLFPVEEVRRSAGALPAPTVELLTRHAWEVLAPAPADSNRLIVRVDRLTPRGTERLNINGRLTTFKDKEGFYLTRMSGADAARVTTGDVLQIKRIDNITLLFHVEELGMLQEDANPPQQFARANEALRLPAQQLPQTPPSALESVERLRFDLLLRVGNDRRPTIEEMSFNFGHPRFWGDTVLIESSGLRPQSEAAARTRESARQSAAARPRGAQLSHAAESAEIFRALRGDARLDASELALLDPAAFGGLLSPVEENQPTFLPLGMLSILDEADIHGPLKTEIGDDRLGQFDTRLFVDAALVPNLSVQPATGDALMAEAFDRHYIQDKRLRGLHGLMFVGEAALVALPEAVQREWPGEIEPDNAPPPPAPPTPEPPDLSKFNDCAPPVTSPPLLPPPVASPPASSPPSAPGLPVLKKSTRTTRQTRSISAS